jgi:hypothetical protein
MLDDRWSRIISATFKEMLNAYGHYDAVADYVERLAEVIAEHVEDWNYSDAAGQIKVCAEVCEDLGDTTENIRAKREAAEAFARSKAATHN